MSDYAHLFDAKIKPPAEASDREMFSDYNRGITVNALSLKYNLARCTVQRRLHLMGVIFPPKVNRPSLSEAQIDEAARLYETGMSFKRVAKQFGVSKSRMLKALRSKVKSRAIGYQDEHHGYTRVMPLELNPVLSKMHADGKSFSSIGRTFGVTAAAVRDRILRYNAKQLK